jgi:NAD+ kinase
MKWGLVGKGDIPHVRTEAARLVAAMEQAGDEVHLEAGLADALARAGRSIADIAADVDLFVTVGGDGTILYTQQLTDKPVFGVNVGAIGFLAEVDPAHALEALAAIRAGKHIIEERHKLAVRLGDERLPDAVNEVTLQTRRIAKLIRFTVRVDGEELDTLRGDGIIVSTPTGSTGYAMSVGGPLVHPKVPGIILAPIAPFKLSARPWVVPASALIEVTLLERDSAQGVQQAKVVVDGQHGFDVDTGATITITQSRKMARFVRLGTGFYERVRVKLAR